MTTTIMVHCVLNVANPIQTVIAELRSAYVVSALITDIICFLISRIIIIFINCQYVFKTEI